MLKCSKVADCRPHNFHQKEKIGVKESKDAHFDLGYIMLFESKDRAICFGLEAKEFVTLEMQAAKSTVP